MICRRIGFAALALGSLLLVGCPKPPVPNPGDTVFGPGSTGADFVDPTRIYGSGAEGLDSRSGSFADGNLQRFEDILKSVYFDTDTAFIAEKERPNLVEAADYLRQNPNDKLLIEGYCDWRGTREYNLTLGERRANTVRDYLVNALGVDPARVQTLSHGDLKAQENVPADRMKEDRRAALVVVR